MMKVDDGKRIHFLAKDKTRMSVLAAIRFMKTSPDFGVKEIVAIQQITDEVKPKTNVGTEPRNHSEWSSHPKLPTGWQVKLTSISCKLLFRPNEKVRGLGKFAAIKWIKSSTNCEESDIDAIKIVANELEGDIIDLLVKPKEAEVKKKDLVEEVVWISDDPSVPAGWKISADSGRFGRSLLSPDGVQMRNRA